MDPEQPQDWTSSITRPLRDNPELELAARRELAERAAEADPGLLAALASRFDAIDRVPSGKRRLLYWLPIALAFSLALGIGIPSAIKSRALQLFVTATTGRMLGSGASPVDAFDEQLTPEQRLFIFGDSTQPTEELAAKGLWKAQPDNPALFGDYVAASHPHPADLLQTAHRIDPDNGWFLLLAAGEAGGGAIHKSHRPYSGDPSERPMLADWNLKDEVRFHEAIRLIEKASKKPRIESYGGRLLKQRLEVFPPETDLLSRVARMMIAASSHRGDVLDLIACANVISARAFLLGEDEDADALRGLLSTAEAFCRSIASQDGNLEAQLVAQTACRSIHEHLLEACEKCGLDEEANRLRPKVETLRAMKKSQHDHDRSGAQINKHADVLSPLALPATEKFGVAPPTLEEMKPGRLMNYALVDRAFLWLAIILSLVIIGLSLPFLNFSLRLKARLGRRFAQLLGPVDWLWIFLAGSVAPLAWLLLITRLTPLGCRDWSLGITLLQPVAIQYSIALLLVFSSTGSVTSWRIRKQAGVLDPGARRSFLGKLPFGIVVLSIPLAGCMHYGMGMTHLFVAGALAVAFILWVLSIPSRKDLDKRSRCPLRSAAEIAYSPALALGVLLCLALLPLTHHAERHWIARDSLMRTSPENYGMGRFEGEGVRLLQAQIQGALDAGP